MCLLLGRRQARISGFYQRRAIPAQTVLGGGLSAVLTLKIHALLRPSERTGFFVSRFGGFSGRVEVAEVNIYAVMHDRSPPFFSLLIPVNAPKSRFVVESFGVERSEILRVCDDSQIQELVVQTIAVNVIGILPRLDIEQHPMKTLRRPFSVFALNVPDGIVGASYALCIPLHLENPCGGVVIDKSDLALR
jgi:hypothetical protein